MQEELMTYFATTDYLDTIGGNKNNVRFLVTN